MDYLDEVVAAVAVLAREGQQFPGLGQYGAALRGTRNGDAPAAAELQQSLLAQQVQCPQHRVTVHSQHGRQVRGRGQSLPWPGLALGDSPPKLGGDLLMQRGGITWIERPIDWAYGASHDGFILAGRR